VQVPAHDVWPVGQPQLLHWQSAPHVWIPFALQVCVAAGMQMPSAVHAPHADQVPFVQLRVWVPHSPQLWLLGPVHDGPRGDTGSGAGVMTDDQAPQLGWASVLDRQAVVTTSIAPRAPALAQAPAGNCSVLPATVQSVPLSNATQQAFVPQTPLPPSGNCSATLTLAGSVPAGSAIVQLVWSTTATTAPAKQSCTSKQPAPVPASARVPASGTLTSMVGTADGGSTDVWQLP
jgi:hypothetical protein